MKRLLLVFVCYFRGWAVAIAMPGVLSLKWFVNASFALSLGFGAAKIFYDTFANSAAVESIAGEMPFGVAADFLLYNIGGIRELAIAAAPIVVIFLLLNVYLTGGILAAMDTPVRMTWAAFFAACGRFFFPIAGVTVLTAILAGLLVVLPYIGLEKLHGIVTENATTSQTSFIFTWVWWVIVALLASWVLRVHDYARILLVTEPGRKLFTTYASGMRFAARHLMATFVLWLAFMCTPLLFLYAYREGTVYLGDDTLLKVLLVFALGQLFVLLRIAAFVARLAGQMRFLSAHPPLSAGPDQYVLNAAGENVV